MSYEVLTLINKLSKDKKNKIWIISSEERQKVHDSFGKLTSLGLAAEDGYFYRNDSEDNKTANDWTLFNKDQD